MDKIDRELITDLVLTSNEVINMLGINRSRLSQLVKKGKLIPIKKGMFLLEDVLKRNNIQKELRQKYYKRSGESK